MNINLTRDADKLICLIYKEYLSRRKNNVCKSNAKLFDLNSINISFSDFNSDDFYDTLSELKNKGFIKLFISGEFVLLDEGIIYMEKRFLNKIDKVIDYLKIFT